jgi:hypothetical protein
VEMLPFCMPPWVVNSFAPWCSNIYVLPSFGILPKALLRKNVFIINSLRLLNEPCVEMSILYCGCLDDNSTLLVGRTETYLKIIVQHEGLL